MNFRKRFFLSEFAKFLAADDALERVMDEMGRNRFVGIV